MTRPLRIASARGIPGTAGALVSDGHGSLFLLASHHVVFGEGIQRGDPVWAIPSECNDDARDTAVRLGVACRGVIGRVTYHQDACFVDCALIALGNQLQFPDWLRHSIAAHAWPSRTADPAAAMPVVKNGGTSGLTYGVISDPAYGDAPLIDGREWTASIQVLVDSRDPQLMFACPGDSGAALLDGDGAIVGLVWGATVQGQGIACPIGPVLESLDVSLAENVYGGCR